MRRRALRTVARQVARAAHPSTVTLPDPSSTRSTILLYVSPPFAPVLMSVRMASGDAPLWQVGLAMALTLASILGLTWLAGRVYANAALHLGTRVRFWDAFRG